MKKSVNKKQGGYIAIMATIIISLILLTLILEAGFSGSLARFNILSTEAKEQASILAENCLERAVSSLIVDPDYTGDIHKDFGLRSCYIFPVEFDSPSAGLLTLKTQAIVRGSYANFTTQMNMSDMHSTSVSHYFYEIPGAP